MPKLSYKCFAGSFLLSLAAVFTASKVYLVMAEKDAAREEIAPKIKTKNIELYALNEDNDILYNKFNRLKVTNPRSVNDMPEETVSVDGQDVLPVKDSFDDNSLLYAPEEDEEETSLVVAESDNDKIVSPEDIAEQDGVVNRIDEFAADNSDDDGELKIADASEAVSFNIPLIHNFKTSTESVSVSSEADGSQIALASNNVSINNLGTTNKASVTSEEQDSPWEVATAANKYASKNSINEYTSEHKNDVSAIDKSQQDVAKSEDEKQVAYKIQKNLLVPIPDEIMNDQNLTPQFSSSAENQKIEDSLRDNSTLPPLSDKDKDKKKVDSSEEDDLPDLETKEEDGMDEKTSKNLSDSIAAWFSSATTKSSSDKVINATPKDAKSNSDQSNSIFGKLLGKGKKNVTPTELKLFFQPNKAEISGQTLDWLHAFADNAVRYDNVMVEIRIDKSSSQELQQKRLRMLHKIFANNGVEKDKINIIFTDREPNSFIIRNVRYTTDETTVKDKSPWY